MAVGMAVEKAVDMTVEIAVEMTVVVLGVMARRHPKCVVVVYFDHVTCTGIFRDDKSARTMGVPDAVG